MKFRQLLTATSVLAVICFASFNLSAQEGISSAPAILLRGLLMLQLQDSKELLIGFPDAPGHKATITLVLNNDQKVIVPIKGHGSIVVSEPQTSPAVVKVPELVRMNELYGEGVKPLLNKSPNTISIPWSGIRRVSVDEVTKARYTFVRKDNGEEVESFRPRQLAESLRIELTSPGAVNSNHIRTPFNSEVKEIRIEHLPDGLAGNSSYTEHFHHYLHYVLRPTGMDFDLEPRKLSGSSSRVPRVGNSFWINGEILCYPIRLD